MVTLEERVKLLEMNLSDEDRLHEICQEIEYQMKQLQKIELRFVLILGYFGACFWIFK